MRKHRIFSALAPAPRLTPWALFAVSLLLSLIFLAGLAVLT